MKEKNAFGLRSETSFQAMLVRGYLFSTVDRWRGLLANPLLFLSSTEDEDVVPSRDVSRHFEDPSYGYKDFSRRGEHVPTFRVQVRSGAGRNAGIQIPCCRIMEGGEPSQNGRQSGNLGPFSSGLQLGGSWVLPSEPSLPRRWAATG